MAAARVAAVSVKVAVPPTGRSTVVAMLPFTGPAALHAAPSAPTQVQFALPTCARDRTVSVTVAPTAASGPAFETTIVQVTASPAVYVSALSVFVIETSDTGAAPPAIATPVARAAMSAATTA